MKYELNLSVYDDDVGENYLFGNVLINLEKIFINPNEEINDTFVLKNKGKET